MDEQKTKQIYEVLMTPIVCTGYSKGKVSIVKTGNIIKSTQTYYPYKKWNIPLDEDMSDFAMGFYEILYKSILEGDGMVNEEDDLCSREFAGDTMSSFNYIANLFPQAGRSRKSRTPKIQWPHILQEWEQQYHCLANFWIIPLQIGRKNDSDFSKGSFENGLDDYVDRFLELIYTSDNLDAIFSGVYKSIEDFAAKHFLIGSYINEDSSIIKFSDDTENPDIMIKRIFEIIKARAMTIANSDYAIELWNYFCEWDLIKGQK